MSTFSKKLKNNKKIAIIYPEIYHFRIPIFKKLKDKFGNQIQFYYDKDGYEYEDKSAEIFKDAIHIKSFGFKKYIFQPGYLKYSIFSKENIFIFHFNPYAISTVLFSFILRLRGKKVIFWTHGWTKKERGLKLFVRNFYYKLANYIFLYDEKAKSMGIKYKFAPQKLVVINNSLDYEKQRILYTKLLKTKPKTHLKPYFLIISRLIKSPRIDIAIKALELLLNNNKEIDAKLIIIGEGPELNNLKYLSENLNLDVDFKGAIYQEEILSKYIYNSISVVSPGKVGLLALHSLVYNKSVITHSDYNYQMPEFQALLETKNCFLFEKDDIKSCANAMKEAINFPKKLKYDSSIFEKKYSPNAQYKIIKNIIDQLN